ncbi:MAG: ABC transporter substrate-binding protein [Myxococcota bacterium]
MKRPRRLIRLLAATLLSAAAGAVAPRAAHATGGGEAIEKPVRTLISAVRYGKDSLALGSLDGERQAQALLAADFDKASPAQRAEFVMLFHRLFAAMAFPKIRADFQHLETILYEPATVAGDRAEMGSTLVILHPMKKQEIKLRYALAKGDKGWKVVDVTIVGDKSMLTNIRNDQVGPILKEGGFSLLLELMRKRAAEISPK